MLGRIGCAFRELGRHDEALRMMEETLDFRQRTLPNDPTKIQGSLHHHGLRAKHVETRPRLPSSSPTPPRGVPKHCIWRPSWSCLWQYLDGRGARDAEAILKRPGYTSTRRRSFPTHRIWRPRCPCYRQYVDRVWAMFVDEKPRLRAPSPMHLCDVPKHCT